MEAGNDFAIQQPRQGTGEMTTEFLLLLNPDKSVSGIQKFLATQRAEFLKRGRDWVAKAEGNKFRIQQKFDPLHP